LNILQRAVCSKASYLLPHKPGGTIDWSGHIPFGFWIVEQLSPRRIVELGTYRGDSFNAFCQSVHTFDIDARLYAVDTWRGDEHVGEYGDEIYNELKAYVDFEYPSIATLMRMTFDDAIDQFEDGSIDLLHIDGLHTYEAVAHDYKTWLPKLSPNGVVLLHDVSIRDRNFGVWRLWDEIKGDGPSVVFPHGNGLGVIAPGGSPSEIMTELAMLSDHERMGVFRFFEFLGMRCMYKLKAEYHQREEAKARSAVEAQSKILTEQVEAQSKILTEQIDGLKIALKTPTFPFSTMYRTFQWLRGMFR
jgi:hypothetical protein